MRHNDNLIRGGYSLNVRNSGIELLRLICMFGIVYMHTFGFGVWYTSITDWNLVFGIGINSIFNAGVSIFILISGYFGLSNRVSKIVRLECEVVFFSVVSVIVKSYFQEALSLTELIKSFFPIFTNKYWFMTAYMLLMIFSPYIDRLISCLSKKEFMSLIFCMLCIFSVFPTFLYFDIMEDGGKGVLNMLLIYLIGRWIRLYGKETYPRKNIILSIIAIFCVGFGANCVLSFLRGGEGVFAPFARDCSLIIIILSVLLFLLFRELRFKSIVINTLAKHVLAVYLLESTIRTILNSFLDLNNFYGLWYFVFVIGVYVIAVMLCCMIVDCVRQFIFKRLEAWLGDKTEHILNLIITKGLYKFVS